MKNRKLAMLYFAQFGEVADLYYTRRAFTGEHGRWVARYTTQIPGLPIGFHDPNRGIPGVAVHDITTASLLRHFQEDA